MTMTTKILLLPLITRALAGCVQERRGEPTDYGTIIHLGCGAPVDFRRDGVTDDGRCPRCGTVVAEPIPGTEWKRLKNHACKGVAE